MWPCPYADCLRAVHQSLSNERCADVLSFYYRFAELKAEYEASLVKAYVPNSYVKQQAVHSCINNGDSSDSNSDSAADD
jgi:hypothetical protein